MKRFSLILATATLALAPLLTHAATLLPGDLVKGSTSSVYYYGADHKRYVFPTEKTFKSWYAGFDTVKTISDAELGSLTIGGNITYRPGLRLVKITTDPKVYAIGANGTLRWITTEEIARTLYGVNWSTQVDDIPDSYFTNYHAGASIASTSDFSPLQETVAASSIAADRAIVVSPVPPAPVTPTSTAPVVVNPYVGTVELSRPTAAINTNVNVLAKATNASTISAITIAFDGVFYKRCEYSPCSSDVQMIGSKATADAVATFEWITGQKTYATSTVALQSGGIPGISIVITRPEVRLNGTREVIIDSDNRFIAKTIDVYIDGYNVRGCTDQQQCRYAGEELSPVHTIHSVYAILRDTSGYAKQTETKYFTVVANEHPLVTVATGKNVIFTGEQVDVTVNATDDSGISWTEVWVDQTLIKHCASATCTANIGPWSSGRQIEASGKASDATGLVGYGTSTTVLVQ